MNRTRTTFAIVAVAAIVFLSLAPAAQALPMRGKPSVSESGGSWLDAVLVWLGGLLPGQGDTVRTMDKDEPNSGGRIWLPIDITPYTGSCIDPNGCTWGG